MNCPCCSGKLHEECCEVFHSKKEFPKTFRMVNIYGKPHCPAKENSMTKVNWKFGEKKTLGQNWKSSIPAKKK